MARSNWIPPLVVVPQQHEAAHGIMLRLIDENGLHSLQNFQIASGLKMSHVFAGRHLSHLSVILNIPEVDLQARAFQIQADKPVLVHGHELRKVDIDRKNRRVCVHCLADNPYQRFWWDLNFITHCPTHNVRLVGTCPCGQALTWRDREVCRCRKCRTGTVIDQPSEQISSPLAFERWALTKLGVWEEHHKTTLLDAMKMKDAVSLMARLGSLDAIGGGAFWRASGTDGEELHEYREAGYRIVQDDGLTPLFERIHQQSQASRGSPPESMQASLGWFWSWFTHAGGVKLSPELAQTLARHFDNHFVLNKQQRYVPRGQSTLFDLPKPAIPIPGTVQKMLPDQAVVPHRLYYARQEISVTAPAPVSSALDIIESKNAQAFLGVRIPEWNTLLKHRLLKVDVTPLSGNRVNDLKLVSRTQLSNWIEALARGASTMDQIPQGCSTIVGPDRLPNVDFLHLMLLIDLRRVDIVGRLNGATGLASLIVDNIDIAHLH